MMEDLTPLEAEIRMRVLEATETMSVTESSGCWEEIRKRYPGQEALVTASLASVWIDRGWTLPAVADEADRRFLRYVMAAEHGEGAPLTLGLEERLAMWRRLERSAREKTLGPGEGPGATWERFLERIRGRGPNVDRYQFEEEIARGGMGVVHRVFDLDFRRALALKLSRSDSGESLEDDGSLGRFLEEAQITGQLDHPGIVPVHEVGLDAAGRVYFTMKLVKGQDLRSIFERVADPTDSEWTTARALNVILRVCEAMAYAHAKGVIHRDLKPGNVMVGKYGEVYVMDWGLARILGAEDTRDLRLTADATETVRTERLESSALDSPIFTMDGAVVGTPAYMPPEQARGRVEEIGAGADVYSVGAMLYHLVAGRMPYTEVGDRMSSRTILALVTQGPPAPLAKVAPDAPPELVAIVEKAMARDIGDRYADMSALAQDLRAFLENRVVAAYEAGAWAELRKWVKRNRSLATTIAAAFWILLGVAVWALFERGTAERRAREFDQLAQVIRLEDANRAEALLYPAWPDKVDALQSWLVEHAAPLTGARPAVELAIEELRREDSLDPAQRFLLRLLTDTVEELRSFERLTVPSVEERLSWARALEEATFSHPGAGATWDEARDAIAQANGKTASTLYADVPIELIPQPGLVPIGMNPLSGLWEFYHLRSAWEPGSNGGPVDVPIPVRDAETGHVTIEVQTGIVFVLIPGGEFLMGASSIEGSDNYDPRAEGDELPLHRVKLDPFFMARHELTQSQWARLSGGDEPSRHRPGREEHGIRLDGRHPVESVSWSECYDLLTRHGLVLPTEAQWEYACRAGTSTPWHTGASSSSLDGYCLMRTNWNLDSEDGCHAPVGSLLPNPFGLHDMHGNIMEWCADWWGGYHLPWAEGTGERMVEEQSGRTGRGGSFVHGDVAARSADRRMNGASFKDEYLGVRAARRLIR